MSDDFRRAVTLYQSSVATTTILSTLSVTVPLPPLPCSSLLTGFHSIEIFASSYSNLCSSLLIPVLVSQRTAKYITASL